MFRPFHEQVRAMRLLRGLSQGELGELMGAAQVRVAQLESPDRPAGLGSAREVAAALECTLVLMLVPHEVTGEGPRGQAVFGRMKPGRKRVDRDVEIDLGEEEL